MKRTLLLLTAAFALLTWHGAGTAAPIVIDLTTADGRGADAQVSENNNGSGGDGTGAAINARFNNNDRNEHILLRFDLAEAGLPGPGTITGASIGMTPFRDDGSKRSWELYGLPPAAAGHDWNEATIEFSTAPGVIFDRNSKTHGVDTSVWTSITTGSFPNMNEGSEITLTGAGALSAFLSDSLAEGGGQANLLLRRTTNSNGQSRFASKEATSLDGGSPTGPAGTWAPRLALTFYPAIDATYSGSGVISDMGTPGWDSDRLPNLSGDLGTIAPGATCRVKSGDKNWAGELIVQGTLKLQDEPYTYALNARLQGGELTVVTSGTRYRRYNGPLVLDDVPGNTVNVGHSGSQYLQFYTGSVITGPGGFTKAGPGRLHMEAANTYTGATHVDEGTIRIYHTEALQNSTVHINVNNGLDLRTDNTVLGGLAGAGALDLKAYTLQVGNNGADTSYGGTISGTGALAKVGGGTLTLTGENSYGGGTTVSGGTLRVNNATGSGTGTGDVIVENGGALGGTGSIGGAATVQEGGTLAPGNADGSPLSLNGALALNHGAVWDWEFLNTTSYDQVGGSELILPAGDGALALNIFGLEGYEVAAGDRFTLFEGDVTNFSDALNVDIFDHSGWSDRGHGYGWTLAEGSLILMAVPEPGSLLLAGMGLLTLLTIARRRRKQ